MFGCAKHRQRGPLCLGAEQSTAQRARARAAAAAAAEAEVGKTAAKEGGKGWGNESAEGTHTREHAASSDETHKKNSAAVLKHTRVMAGRDTKQVTHHGGGGRGRRETVEQKVEKIKVQGEALARRVAPPPRRAANMGRKQEVHREQQQSQKEAAALGRL